ncbi:Gfo/Idh/MocA family protein [Lacibacterium aquatile]|uniref:Gfo/Idh/MocA family protein n=1 Tax=Lacibacterium aquatile TaxID=1168082 RepID=A0ABW5DRW1_9PROT
MSRRIRLGMVGGGQGAFIGAVHRIASRLDDKYELVAGAFSSDPEKSKASAAELHIAVDRAYGSYQEMAEAEAKRADKIDAVAIVTPNHLHYPQAKLFLEKGFHVICDKPLTTNVQDAEDLVALVKKSGLIFGLTHNYTGYPMVRQAREMVAAGDLGQIRLVQVEYPQDWMVTAVEKTGHRGAEWRTDPKKSGAGALGDIGSHAFNIASFVSGLTLSELAADVSSMVEGRVVDDNVQVLLRFKGGAKGSLWASQVATGHGNALRLRVFGDKASLFWEQEYPNDLHYNILGQPPRLVVRNGAGSLPVAAHASRVPGGHPEGYLEGFTQIYTDLAEQITAKLEGRAPKPEALLVPTVEHGLDGMRFIHACLESGEKNAGWVTF